MTGDIMKTTVHPVLIIAVKQPARLQADRGHYLSSDVGFSLRFKLLPYMCGNEIQILHHGFRIPENMGIDFLQNIILMVFIFDDDPVGFMDMP
jgi:hypothetical protein